VKREGVPFVAIGAAACVACCAPPILAAVGITVGLATAAWLVGGVLAAAAVVLGGTLVIRRRRATA
jgi:hypothetical protein